MKNLILTLLLICPTLGLASCKKEAFYRPAVCTIALDQYNIEVDVTPNTKYVVANFHDNGYVLQGDEFVELGLFVDAYNTTAELNKHFSIMAMSRSGWVNLSYNLSPTTGNMVIQLYPENITKELMLVLKTPDEKEKLYVKLKPAVN